MCSGCDDLLMFVAHAISALGMTRWCMFNDLGTARKGCVSERQVAYV